MTPEEEPKVNPAEKSYSWFCVLDGPELYFNGTPEEMVEEAIVTYCRSPTGMPHLHMVLEDAGMARFSAVKAAFPKAHIEATKGTKSQAEAYIFKEGKFKDSEEEILEVAQRGEVKGRQGHRSDFDRIQELIADSLTPREILAVDAKFWRNEAMIKKMFYAKRDTETPYERPVKVIYHIGDVESGKTYTSVKLLQEHGEANFFRYDDYERGGWDRYMGQGVVCQGGAGGGGCYCL